MYCRFAVSDVSGFSNRERFGKMVSRSECSGEVRMIDGQHLVAGSQYALRSELKAASTVLSSLMRSAWELN
ncbi:MAG: hypothetical protein M2R45_03956 [Verrucomicrobia subdivision 3 bacterium]|nr:hypothetical protein [Limisphaerales bacterium]MCS1415524.1 hypothetical protein [Limisphaerales bacterium]